MHERWGTFELGPPGALEAEIDPMGEPHLQGPECLAPAFRHRIERNAAIIGVALEHANGYGEYHLTRMALSRISGRTHMNLHATGRPADPAHDGLGSDFHACRVQLVGEIRHYPSIPARYPGDVPGVGSFSRLVFRQRSRAKPGQVCPVKPLEIQRDRVELPPREAGAVLLDQLSDGDIASARVVAQQTTDQILHIRQWLALTGDGLEVPLGHFPEVDPGLMEELEQLGGSALNEFGAQLDRLSRWPRDGVHPSTEAG